MSIFLENDCTSAIYNTNAARYGMVFAADVNPYDYAETMTTDCFVELSIRIGNYIETERVSHANRGKDFYPVLFAENAAEWFNTMSFKSRDTLNSILKSLLRAGQKASDDMAKG